MKRTSRRASRWTPNQDVAIEEGIRKHFVGKISKFKASNAIADEVFMGSKMGTRTWEGIRQRARKLMRDVPSPSNSRKRRPKGASRKKPKNGGVFRLPPPSVSEDVMEIDGIVFESLPESANAYTQTEDDDHEVQPRAIDENIRSLRDVLAMQGGAIRSLIEDRNSLLGAHDEFRRSFFILRNGMRKMIDNRNSMADQVGREINRQKACFNPLVVTAEILENVQSHFSSPEFNTCLEEVIQRVVDRRSTKLIQDFLDNRADRVIHERPEQWTDALNMLKLRYVSIDPIDGKTK